MPVPLAAGCVRLQLGAASDYEALRPGYLYDHENQLEPVQHRSQRPVPLARHRRDGNADLFHRCTRPGMSVTGRRFYL